MHLLTDRPHEVFTVPADYDLEDGRTVRIEALTRRGNRWTCQIGGDDSGEHPRDRAARMTGAVLVRTVDELPPRPDGEYSDFQIVGCRVEDSSGRTLGEISRIERRYEVDTWIIAGDGGMEGEIPAVAEFILNVDLDRRVIVVNRAGFNR